MSQSTSATKTLLFTLLTLLQTPIFAQSSYQITYRASNNALAEMFRRGRSLSQGGQGSALFADEDIHDRTMTLTTDGRRSVFTEKEDDEEMSDDDGPRIIYVSQIYWGEGCRVFKDYDTKRVLMEQYFQVRQPYLIADSTFNRQWKIEKEYKEIMGMSCQKATSADTITAWFAIDVPIPDGTHTYGGLPGLIMALDDNQEQYECTAIEETSEKVPATPKGETTTMEGFLAAVSYYYEHKYDDWE